VEGGLRVVAVIESLGDEVWDDFCIGIATERDAVGFEFGFEVGVVFDNPVVDEATRPLSSVWGWALRSVGGPWVDQRVWPMP